MNMPPDQCCAEETIGTLDVATFNQKVAAVIAAVIVISLAGVGAYAFARRCQNQVGRRRPDPIPAFDGDSVLAASLIVAAGFGAVAFIDEVIEELEGL